MRDPWKYIAFPVSAVTGYMISLGVTEEIAPIILMPEFTTSLLVVAITGFLTGFMIDQVIPAYIEKISSSAGGEADFSEDEDFDFE